MRQAAIFALILAAGAYFLTTGQWALIAGLMVIILGHEFGHWAVARSFGIPVPVFSIGFGSKPRIRLGSLWGTEFQITPWLIGGYVQIDPNDESFARHDAWKRISVLLAGVTMNVIMAVVFMFAAYTWLGKPVGYVAINHVVAEQPAAVAGIHDGDHLVAVDGAPVSTVSEVITRVQKHPKGLPFVLTLERNGQQLPVHVAAPDGRLGVELGQGRQFQPVGIAEAASRGVSDVWFLTKQTANGFGMMLGIVPNPAGADTTVHGIVGIVQIGGAAFDAGIFSFIWLLAALNINLLFLNILPLPLLDGGHVAFIVWEKLTGKRVPLEIQGRIAMASLVLLGSLMAFGLWNDFMHPVFGK